MAFRNLGTALRSVLIIAPTMSATALAASVEENYTSNCAVCHLPGISGAPKVGDKAEWTRRARSGFNLLYRSALEGVPNSSMTPKGGARQLTDDEVKAIVDYMVAAAAVDRTVLDAAARYDKLGIADRDFIRLDSDRDGFLSNKELAADAVLARNLNRFDSNRDGKWNVTEYRNAETTLERERTAVDVDDAALVKSVRDALARVGGLDLPRMKIEVNQGAVALIGLVDQPDAARAAYDAVKRIAGIKKIDNRLVTGQQMQWD